MDESDDQFFKVREHEVTAAEMVETARIEDFSVPGPRRSEFSHRPEVRCMLLHSLKNCEMSSWRHNFDVLMSTNLLPTDFMSTLRRAIAVSNIFNFITYYRSMCSLILFYNLKY